MRRRPSASGEDDDGPQPEHARTSDSANTSGHMKTAGRKASRDVGRTRAQQQQEQESRVDWTPTTTMTEPVPLEKSSLDTTAARGKAGTDDDATRTGRQGWADMRRPWRCSFLTLATSVFSILLLGGMVQSFLNLQLDLKGCGMSYMMPSFARFSDFDTEHTRFASKYSLYLYREGGVDLDTRVKGVPVLFIPGNAGSYKQMRPIAAEAAHHFHDVLRQDETAVAEGKRPLDFFTVDFNEELTAFHGQTLLDQAEYLNEAVAYILALYHNPNRSLREPGLPDPKSVIIVGHSMGGVVARTMLRMPNYQADSINTIITLSAPHARAPISFDADMVAAYNDVNSFWRQSYSAPTPEKNPLSDVALVSVAGGGLDTMIASEYSSLTSLVPDTHGFTVFTSSIPSVWTGMDHLAIMWCNQFRKALVRAIFDVVDARRSSQTRVQPERIVALRKRLLTGMESVVEKTATKRDPTTPLTLENKSMNMVPPGTRLNLRAVGASATAKTHILSVPAEPRAKGSKFTLMTNQRLEPGDENGTLAVLLCTAAQPPSGGSVFSFAKNLDVTGRSSGSTRLACTNAATDASLLPASTNESVNAFDDAKPFSYLQYDLEDLADTQFVAVIERPSSAPGWLVAEFTDPAESTILVSKGHHQLLMNGLQLTLPASRPMMVEMKIPEVHSTLFAYELGIHRRPCGPAGEVFAPLLRQYIQEPYESKYFVNTKGGNINVHGISPYMPPPLSGGGASEGLSLQLWTDPSCNSNVDVSLKVDLLGSAGKLVMRYRTIFAASPVLVVAIVLRKQFKVYDATGVFMSFSQSMDRSLRTSLPLIFTALTFLSVALSKASHGRWTRNWIGGPMATPETSIDFTVNDLMLGTSDPFFWFLVPLFGLISVGICIAINYAVLVLAQIFAWLYARTRTFVFRLDTAIAPFSTTSPQQRLLTTGILLLLVATVIPYQFAYLVLCLVQIATCVRALHIARTSQSGPAYNFYNYVHSMLVLMLWILPINMPVLTVWINNLAVHWLSAFSSHHNLLAVLPLILLVETMSTGNMVPRVTCRTRHLTNILIFALALYAALNGVSYAYRLHHLVNALGAWLFLLHASAAPLLQRLRGKGG